MRAASSSGVSFLSRAAANGEIEMKSSLSDSIAFPRGRRIFSRSLITGEELESFIPAPIGKLILDSQLTDIGPDAAGNPQRGPILPFAAIIASRGRMMLSADVLEHTRSFVKLLDQWTNKNLSTTTICDLHAQLTGKKTGRSQFRDSMVWVRSTLRRAFELPPLLAKADRVEWRVCRARGRRLHA